MFVSVVGGWESGQEPPEVPSCAEEGLALFQSIILLSRERSLTVDSLFLWIRESTSWHVILQMDFTLLIHWDKTYMFQIKIIYCGSVWNDLFVIDVLLGRLDQWMTLFHQNFHSTMILCKTIVSTFLHAACMHVIVHGNPLTLSSFQLSHKKSLTAWIKTGHGPGPKQSKRGQGQV